MLNIKRGTIDALLIERVRHIVKEHRPMNTIQTLRTKVELPAHYSVKMPLAERKRILRNAIAEQNLSASMRPLLRRMVAKKVAKRNLYLAKGNRILIVAFAVNSGPTTSKEVALGTGLSSPTVCVQIGQIVKLGYFEKVAGKREVCGRGYLLYQITKSGREYVIGKQNV